MPYPHLHDNIVVHESHESSLNEKQGHTLDQQCTIHWYFNTDSNNYVLHETILLADH